MNNCIQTQRFTQTHLFSAAEEAALFHSHEDSNGLVAIGVRGADRTFKQNFYYASQLQTVMRLLDPMRDTYISVSEFWSKKRLVTNMKSVEEVFIDIDCMGLAWAAGKTPEQIDQAFRFVCHEEGVPEPSISNWSGRGLHVKWLLKSTMPRPALCRWNALESALVKRFETFGGDQKAKDAARILRVVQTYNTKGKQFCRTLNVLRDVSGEVLRYDFDYLAEFVLPFTRDELSLFREEKAAKTKGHIPEGFNLETLNWARVEDFRTLIRVRGGIAEGMRMNFALYMLSALAGSHQISSSTFWIEASNICKEIDPAWNFRNAEFKTLYNKFLMALRGKTVEWNGKQYSPIYTPRNSTLIDLFEITAEEMRWLKTIIDEDTRRQRNTETQRAIRRDRGVLPRHEYEARSEARRERAIELAQKGLSVRAIAKEMGMSAMSVSRYLRV